MTLKKNYLILFGSLFFITFLITNSIFSKAYEQWIARYNGPGRQADYVNKMVIDSSGNIYVTGESLSPGRGYDYVTVKYNNVGAQQWVARYNGPDNGWDRAYGIAVDSSSNVYVTGSSKGAGTDYDYATIKYNSEGVEQWVARYNGPGNRTDNACAIVLDPLGNIYVTGMSYGLGTTYSDYATIKYNSDGVEQWVARYNGPSYYDDASAITVDSSGNVYVTGDSGGSGTNYDYATIKYNSSGVQQWVARYNGEENYGDFAKDITIDSLGNVYVTGDSDDDYVTVKYNNSGVQQWLARYKGPGGYDMPYDIAVDSSGNVYVTGDSVGSVTSYDYATIKYNSSGVEQWVARYNGPGNYFDIAYALAVDSSGNVYVTGYSQNSGTSPYNADYTTIKYNSLGVEQWVVRYSGPGNGTDEGKAISIDDSGNVYVTGYSEGSGTDSDYTTLKYNNSGVQQWVARFNGLGDFNDYAYDIAIDSSGNVYVTGESDNSGIDFDYVTIKYSSTGLQQWANRYNGPGNSFDTAHAIAVDNLGNVYVTGESEGSGTYSDYATIKYNSAGLQKWVARYNGPTDEFDDAYAIVVDISGNVYVTGYSDWDYSTLKYNSLGIQQWVARYNGPGNSIDWARGMAVDTLGNVYVTGDSYGSGTYSDYATIKYNNAGVQQWVARYNGPGNKYDKSNAIAIDKLGNVYVTGYSRGSVTIDDYATIKYNSSGVQQWVARYNGTGNGDDFATDITVDNLSNIYVTGYSKGSGTLYDYATVKYDSSGVQQWVARYNGTGNYYDYAHDMVLDSFGDIYITGYSANIGAYPYNYDYVTIKYNSAGEEQWIAKYNGLGNGYDQAYAIAVDNAGNVYLTGQSYNTETGPDFTTIKYLQSTSYDFFYIY